MQIDQFNVVPKYNVTPAEVALLIAAYTPKAQKNPITDLVCYGEVEQPGDRELRRLQAKYGGLKNPDNKKEKLIDRIFPHHLHVPQEFKALGEGFEAVPKVEASEAQRPNWTPGTDEKVVDTELDALDAQADKELQAQQAREKLVKSQSARIAELEAQLAAQKPPSNPVESEPAPAPAPESAPTETPATEAPAPRRVLRK